MNKKCKTMRKNGKKRLKILKTKAKPNFKVVFIQIKCVGLFINLNPHQKYRKPLTKSVKP